MSISEYLSDTQKARKAAVDFCLAHPGVDSIHSPTMCAYTLAMLWLSEVKIPGVDLPEDALWQMDEKENMTFEDYARITEEGYEKWFKHYAKKKLGDPVPKTILYMLGMKKSHGF